MLIKIKQDDMPDNKYGEQTSYSHKSRGRTVSANFGDGVKEGEFGATFPTFEINIEGKKQQAKGTPSGAYIAEAKFKKPATPQMQVDPLTGAPITAPGPGSLTTSRSSQLFEATNPGYAQGSMENAMKNPLITGVAQYGLKQKEEFDPVKADKNNNGVVEDWEKASVKSFTK
jgi:hypothetical protein